MSKPVIADISVPFLKVVARFAARDVDRPSIAGVRIEPHPDKGILLVATDGHRMMVVHDEKGRCKRAITLSAKEALALARKQDKSGADLETRWRVSAKSSRGLVGLPVIDEAYPAWARLVDMVRLSRGGSAFAVNPSYLSDFAKAARELQPCKNPAIRIVPSVTHADPILICFPEADHAFGVLMPMAVPGGAGIPRFMIPVARRSATKNSQPATRRKSTDDARPKAKAGIVP